MATGRSWLFLRGLARGVGHWGSFAQTVQERFPEDRFEFIDLPGNGARFAESSPVRISDYVKDLRSRCSYVQSGEPFQIFSVSLGSMITVEWMREFPHEVQKAFLVCTSSAGLSPFYERFFINNIPKGLAILGRRSDPAAWEKAVLGLVANDHDRRKTEMLSMLEYDRANPLQPLNVIRQLIAASQYRFPTKAPGDIRLIGSYGDRLVSPKCTLRIAEKWGLKATMHSWAGHDIPIDDPHWLIEQLL